MANRYALRRHIANWVDQIPARIACHSYLVFSAFVIPTRCKRASTASSALADAVRPH